MKVTLLGVRGSVPVSGTAFARYGGDTLSVLVEEGGQSLLLDGGTGLRHAPPLRRAALLLTHAHVDHLLGLPVWQALYDPAADIEVYGKTRGGRDVQGQLAALISPPLWPVALQDAGARLTFHDLPEGWFTVNGFTVTAAEGSHPGGVSVYRIDRGGRSVVLCTDCELDEAVRQRLFPLAAGCDLLLADGQYGAEDYPAHRGWGHSSDAMASAFGALCGAGRTVLLHHDPLSRDDALDARGFRLGGCTLGAQGEEIFL